MRLRTDQVRGYKKKMAIGTFKRNAGLKNKSWNTPQMKTVKKTH
jgi:hypothetical protein